MGFHTLRGFTRLSIYLYQTSQTFAHVSWVKALILFKLTHHLATKTHHLFEYKLILRRPKFRPKFRMEKLIFL